MYLWSEWTHKIQVVHGVLHIVVVVAFTPPQIGAKEAMKMYQMLKKLM